MKIYVSGPISNGETSTATVIRNNKEAFTKETARLRALGHEVTNPCENPNPDGTWQEHLRVDLAQVCGSDTLCLLPGWEKSRGSRLEVFVALELGLDVVNSEDVTS